MLGDIDARSAQSISLDFSIEGLESVVKAIEKLKDDGTKRRRLLAIYRKQAAPYIQALQSTIPMADRDIVYSAHKSIVFRRGNLRESIKMFPNRKNNDDIVALHVGPQVKKREGSGYYGYFLLPEARAKIGKPRRGYRRHDEPKKKSAKRSGKPKTGGKVDWKRKAWNRSGATIENGLSNELVKYLKNAARRNGWEVNSL